MNTVNRKEAEAWLVAAMTDAFNRSLRALEDAGAIDTRELRKAYYGGSVWYELVTKEMVHVAACALPQVDVVYRAGKED